jgi:hypothetical protein
VQAVVFDVGETLRIVAPGFDPAAQRQARAAAGLPRATSAGVLRS